MSDFDDELLELAEVGSEKKRKKHKASKKRKAGQVVSDYNGSESEDEAHIPVDPYPLEGKYVDELDKETLLGMNEVEREEILAGRAEERQGLETAKSLKFLISQREVEGGEKTSKRQRTAVGATQEKSKKLDELKAKRQARGGGRQKTAGSPTRDGSPMDTGSSEDEEDGQVDRKVRVDAELEDQATLDDFNRNLVTRDMIVKHFLSPWFEEYITNSWVRFLIGNEDGQNVYRLCEVAGFGKDKVKPYKIGDVTLDRTLELQHGKSTKVFAMDRVSNSAIQPREFARLKATLEGDQLKMPTRYALETKSSRRTQLANQALTEADINALLSRKKEIDNATGFKTHGWITMERSRLKQQRTIASRRQDYAEVAVLDAQLLEFGKLYGEERADTPSKNDNDMLAKLTAKNRKANQDAVRKAEIAAAKERKLAKQNGIQDPSARLKTVPRTFNDALSTTTSRAGTPGAPSKASPAAGAKVPDTTPYDVAKTIDSSIVDSIEVDLGDF